MSLIRREGNARGVGKPAASKRPGQGIYKHTYRESGHWGARRNVQLCMYGIQRPYLWWYPWNSSSKPVDTYICRPENVPQQRTLLGTWGLRGGFRSVGWWFNLGLSAVVAMYSSRYCSFLGYIGRPAEFYLGVVQHLGTIFLLEESTW